MLRREDLSVRREAKYIVECAGRLEGKVVTLGGLVFFSTGEGDAWVLDPQDKLALRLAEMGEALPYRIEETATTFAVEWASQYGLSDNGFVVQEGDRKVTVFPTYPVRSIRDAEMLIMESG